MIPKASSQRQEVKRSSFQTHLLKQQVQEHFPKPVLYGLLNNLPSSAKGEDSRWKIKHMTWIVIMPEAAKSGWISIRERSF